MDVQNMRERRLILNVVEVLKMSVLPVGIALEDLRLALLDGDSEQDLGGILDAWASLALGIVKEGDAVELIEPEPEPQEDPGPWHGLPERQRVAMELAQEQGSLSSGELAELCCVSQETARQDLVRLAYEGLLEPHGERRTRRYELRTDV